MQAPRLREREAPCLQAVTHDRPTTVWAQVWHALGAGAASCTSIAITLTALLALPHLLPHPFRRDGDAPPPPPAASPDLLKRAAPG